jgi:Tfp pilus assembly protein PilF
LLAGQLAARREKGAVAVDYAQCALSDNRAKPNEILSAAILILSVTAPDSQPYLSAWNRIEDLARDHGNVMSLDALVFLAQQRAPTPQSTADESRTLSLAQTASARPLTALTASEVADRLEHHPKARPYHQVLALKLRAREEPSHADEILEKAIQRFRSGDDDALLALNTWLFTEGRYQTLLDVMPLERALHRRELYLQYLDALGAVGRFQEVRELLESGRFHLDPVSQHMYLATARSRLGEEAGMANEWERALESANDTDKCLLLGNFAERANAPDIADRAYAQAISFAPKSRAPYDARLRVAEKRGQTARAKQILGEIVRLWPEDNQARNHEAYVALLLGASGVDAEKAAREGEILALREPTNWQARATIALAQLRLGRPAAALEAFSGMKATEGSPVGPLAVRAVVLDANGWKEAAKGDARTLAAAQLLPEERELLAPLLRNSIESPTR